MSTSCPERLAPRSEGLRVRSALPVDSGPGPSARGVDQLSTVTGPMSKSRRVDQISRAIQVRVPVVPRLLMILSEGPRCRPAVLDVSRLGQTSRDVDQLSQTIRDQVRGPAGLTRCPGHSGRVPIAHGVDQQSRENWACASGHTVSTSCPGRLVPGSECLHGKPAVLGVSGTCVSARGINKLSQENQTCAGGPALSTSCPRQLAAFSEGPRNRRALLGDLGS